MGEIDVELRQHLLTVPEVRAAFGEQIFNGTVDDGTVGCYAIISIVNTNGSYTLQDRSAGSVVVQVDIYDDDKVVCDASGKVIETVLDGYRGQIGSLVAGFVFIQNKMVYWDAVVRKWRRLLEVRIGTRDW